MGGVAGSGVHHPLDTRDTKFVVAGGDVFLLVGIGGETNGTFGEGGGGGLRFDGGVDCWGLGVGFDGGLDRRTRVIYMDLVTLTLTLTEPLYPSFEHVVWDMGWGRESGRRMIQFFMGLRPSGARPPPFIHPD